MDLVTLADVRALISGICRKRRARRTTWQHVEAEFKESRGRRLGADDVVDRPPDGADVGGRRSRKPA